MTKFSSFSQRLCDDLSARKKSGWMEEISPLELKLMIFDNVYHQANICHKCSLLLLWIHKSKLPADTLTNTFPFWQPNQLFLLIEFLSEWKWAKFFVVTLQPDNSNNSKKKSRNGISLQPLVFCCRFNHHLARSFCPFPRLLWQWGIWRLTFSWILLLSLSRLTCVKGETGRASWP